MPRKILENNDQISPALVLDNDTQQVEIGVDGNDSNLVKISVQASAGATFGNPMITLDPAVNGDITLTPNGSGTVVISTFGAGTVVSDASGNLSVGTQILNVTALTNADTPYTVLTTDEYLSCDVSGGVLEIDLPNAPTTGRVYVIKDSGGDAGTSNITITTVGGVVTIDGATSFVMNTNYESINVIFNGASYEVF